MKIENFNFNRELVNTLSCLPSRGRFWMIESDRLYSCRGMYRSVDSLRTDEFEERVWLQEYQGERVDEGEWVDEN